MRLRTLSVGSAAALICVVSVGVHAQSSSRDSTAMALRQLYQRFLDGIRLRDTSSYRELLTPDYSSVTDSGIVVHDRAMRLKRDMENPDRYNVFEVDRCELAVRETTAVGPCWYHAGGIWNGRHDEGHGVSLVTFVRTSDGWRIAATRASVLPGKR